MIDLSDPFFKTYENTGTEPKEDVTPNRTFTNISELFKTNEYKDKLACMHELVKVSDALDRPIIILGYKEDTMVDIRTGGDKPCFRMDFKFADDPTESCHYIRTEARYLWDHLKVIHDMNPDLLSSGTLVAMICKGEKKNGKMKNAYYYFAGTMEN